MESGVWGGDIPYQNVCIITFVVGVPLNPKIHTSILYQVFKKLLMIFKISLLWLHLLMTYFSSNLPLFDRFFYTISDLRLITTTHHTNHASITDHQLCQLLLLTSSATISSARRWRKLFTFPTCDFIWDSSFVVWDVRNPNPKISRSYELYRRRYSTSKVSSMGW